MRGPELGRLSPTAVQAVAPHATPLKKLPWPAESTGVGWMVQLLPFHRSAKVVVPEFDVAFRFPAAVQAAGVVQDTAARKPPGGGLGVGWMVQLVPFHRSARVPVGLPKLSVRPPTAVQATANVQDTAARKPPPAGLGVCWMRQFVPSHRSARGRFAAVPVAMQADGAVQDT